MFKKTEEGLEVYEEEKKILCSINFFAECSECGYSNVDEEKEIVKKEKIAIIGFLFPSKEYEKLNPYRTFNDIYDKNFAKEIIRITEIQKVNNYEVLIVAQWGTEKALKARGCEIDFTVLGDAEEYLGIDIDIEANFLIAFLKEQKVDKIIVITDTFIHLCALRRCFQKAGFTVLEEKIRFNGFWKNFLQYCNWMHWKRNPLRLLNNIILYFAFYRYR